MKLSSVWVLFRKELLDLFRDKRTLISLVVAPMVIGPAMISVMNLYTKRSQEQARVERYKVGIREDVPVQGLREALRSAGLELLDVAAPRDSVEKKQVTYGIEVTGKVGRPQVFFYSDNSETAVNIARGRVNEAIEKVRREQIRESLSQRNIPAGVLEPFDLAAVNVAKPRKMTGSILGRLIGFLLLIFLFNGAMYSAVDATAGEKERKTLEILLASAATRTEIVTAKVMTSMLTSLGTTLLSMTSYAIALSQAGGGRSGNQLSFPTDPLTLFMLFLLTLQVALMAASIAIAAATPAKSTREAMSYLTPGIFIVMFLGLVTFFAEGAPNPLLALVPFSNFSLMLRDVLSGEWTWWHYLLTLGANLTYSALAVWLAVRSFTNEGVLFRS